MMSEQDWKRKGSEIRAEIEPGDRFYCRGEDARVCFGEVLSIGRKVTVRFQSHVPRLDGTAKKTRTIDPAQFRKIDRLNCTWCLISRQAILGIPNRAIA